MAGPTKCIVFQKLWSWTAAGPPSIYGSGVLYH